MIYDQVASGGISLAGRVVNDSVWDADFLQVYHLQQTFNGSNNEVIDSTVNENHGKASSAEDWYVSSKQSSRIGYGQMFDRNDWLNVPCTSDDKSSHTFSCWVKVSSPITQSRAIFSRGKTKNDGTGGYSFCLRQIFDGRLEGIVKVVNDNGEWKTYSLKTTSALATNTWYHVALVWEAGVSLKIYVSGNLVASKSISESQLVPSVAGNFVGKVDTSQYWFGVIDEVRLSANVRSASWIKAEVEAEAAVLTLGTEYEPAAVRVGGMADVG